MRVMEVVLIIVLYLIFLNDSELCAVRVHHRPTLFDGNAVSDNCSKRVAVAPLFIGCTIYPCWRSFDFRYPIRIRSGASELSACLSGENKRTTMTASSGPVTVFSGLPDRL